MIFSHQPYLTMRRPRRPATSKLVWVNATYAGASGPFEVVATHFTWPTEPIQAGQSLAMRQVTAALPRDRMILAGDFNSTPWSYARRADDAAFGLIRRDRALASWPAEDVDRRGLVAPFPFLPIDHVYAGAGWATVSVTRGPRLGSDHYPIIVTLAPVAR
jgi:endonuclease/exonuclease/phosphatase (EEP) superfamily protein YafD